MNQLTATADRLLRLESQARRLVARSPGNAAQYLTGWRTRLKAFEEGLVELEPHESPSLLRDRIEAFEEAFANAVRCSRCGHALHDSVSVKAGVGPDCRKRIAAVEGRRSTNEESP